MKHDMILNSRLGTDNQDLILIIHGASLDDEYSDANHNTTNQGVRGVGMR